MPEFPIPRIQDIYDSLSGCEIFSTLDLRQGYYQFPVAEDQLNTTVNTPTGPPEFGKIIIQILSGLSRVFCYFDDIIVGGKTRNEHNQNLERVFKKLDECGLKLNFSKCRFGLTSLKFLGHIISKEGIRSDPQKVEAILQARIPTDKTELRSFLGLITYYHKFVPNLAITASPLYELLKIDQPWKWEASQQQAWETLKHTLTDAPVLDYFDAHKQTVLSRDASPQGLAWCCSCANISRWLETCYCVCLEDIASCRKNCSQTELEGLSCVWAITHFHQYLWGRRFILYTDHSALTTIFGPKGDVLKLTAVRLQRWAIRLMGYNFEIRYKEGRSNSNAYALSRFPIVNGGEYYTINAINEETTVQTESDVRGQLMFILTDTEKLCDRQQLRELTASEPVLQTVINALKCQDAKLPLPPGFVT